MYRGDYVYTIYQIMPGDEISTLATKFKTSIENLRRINNLPFNYDFQIGEQIIVPANNDSNFIYYTVKKGDNIYSLSQKYNVDLEILLQINGLNKDDYIYPNEQLMIPSANIETYIVEEGDTIGIIANKLNKEVNDVINENENIYLLPGQLIISTK